jgi:hypothetical protein
MGTVAFKNMREWVQRNGEVCSKCVKMEEELLASTERLKQSYIEKYGEVVIWAKQELTKEIQKLTQKKKPAKHE